MIDDQDYSSKVVEAGFVRLKLIAIGAVLILIMHMKQSKEIIHKRTDIGVHFTREISLAYHINFLTTRRKHVKD